MKTARNCLYVSGSGACSRLMWNDGQHLLFWHIADVFYKDQTFALHVLPKLTLEHISHLGTAEFCRMMNLFFDCTNVRSTTEHIHKKNQFIKPYTSLNDDKFDWLLNVFLGYLENWRKSTLDREGNYSPDARGNIFLSQQTYKGLKIFVYSHVEAIKFLLGNEFEYIYARCPWGLFGTSAGKRTQV